MSDDLSGVSRVMSSLENQLESHIRTTNSKLDILIELTRQMATMQERQNSHSTEITRLERALADSRQQYLQSIEKIDKRVSDVEIDKNKSIDKVLEKLDMLDERNATLIETRDKDLKIVVTDISNKLGTLELDYKEKYSFSRGVMYILSIVLVIAQGLVVTAVTSYSSDMEKNKQSILKLEQDSEIRKSIQLEAKKVEK